MGSSLTRALCLAVLFGMLVLVAWASADRPGKHHCNVCNCCQINCIKQRGKPVAQ